MTSSGRKPMEVREQLVELLMQVEDNMCDDCGREPVGCAVVAVADHLIAHGVTVQKWISVSERLPKNFVSVLGYMTDAGEFPPVRECYTVGNAFFFPALGDIHPVSHWREIPQPPRG